MTTRAPATPQLLLPGQAAAPGGPVDVNLMYVFHHGVRRDIAGFAAVVTPTPVDARRSWQALARRWELFTWVQHHRQASEDAVLTPALVERATEVEAVALESLEARRVEIDRLLASCTAGFSRLARHADPDAQRALAIRVVAARELLGVHLAHQEREAAAVVQRVLSQAEWDDVDRFFRARATPRRLVQLVPWLSWQLPAEARDWLATRRGAGARRVLDAATRPGFARRERAVFGPTRSG